MTDRYVEPPIPPRGFEPPKCTHGMTGPHHWGGKTGFNYDQEVSCPQWASKGGMYEKPPRLKKDPDVTYSRDVSQMDTFTYKIIYNPEMPFSWEVTVFGPNGKKLDRESSWTKWGAYYNARKIVHKHRKEVRVKMRQIDKTASPEITGSFHRKRES